MKLTPKQRVALIHERIAATHSMLGFAVNRAAEAMADFAFAMALAEGTPEAKRAEEIADAAIARALTAPPSP